MCRSRVFFYNLDIAKKQEFAIDDKKRFLWVRCIAAPVFRDNQIIAAVAIAGPSEKIKRSHMRSLTRKVIEGSKEITNEIDRFLI
ncbi:IclR family transcriptional regulator domain-containing protein [Peribacillus loiseleuriae]|uniref:IclR family transcriptional regulator domain-containing protein n=1 Tax=Peribacillus loiseleuriae TaxID=1679170 RepID=UPI0009E33AF5